jgi:hypothetical protein
MNGLLRARLVAQQMLAEERRLEFRTVLTEFVAQLGSSPLGITTTLLVRETPASQAGFAAVSVVRSAPKRTRLTMTWHIGSTNGRPVIRWAMLPARSSIVIDEH